MILAKTENLSITLPGVVQNNYVQWNTWFERVRKLANDNQFAEPLRLYREYWGRISVEKAKAEHKNAHDLIHKYSKEMEALQNQEDGFKKQITEEKRRYNALQDN